MADLTTVETAERFVGKRIRYYKRSWRTKRPEGDALRTRGDYLVILNGAEVEVGLEVRSDDPWTVEEVDRPSDTQPREAAQA